MSIYPHYVGDIRPPINVTSHIDKIGRHTFTHCPKTTDRVQLVNFLESVEGKSYKITSTGSMYTTIQDSTRARVEVVIPNTKWDIHIPKNTTVTVVGGVIGALGAMIPLVQVAGDIRRIHIHMSGLEEI